MRSKNRAWRSSSRRCREKVQAIKLSWEARVSLFAATTNGVRFSATASSATRKPARIVVRRWRRSSGSSGQACGVGAPSRWPPHPTACGPRPGRRSPARSCGSRRSPTRRRACTPVAWGRPGWQPWCPRPLLRIHGATVASALRRSACPPSPRSRAARPGAAGSRPLITHVSKLAFSSTVGRCSSTPAGRSAAELGGGQACDRLALRGPLREQPVDLLDEHEASGAGLAGDPRGDRVGGHPPRRGEPVERQRRGQQHGRPVRSARSADGALGARDQLAQQPAELLHAEDRHAVRGRRRQAEAAVGLAHGVGEPRAAGNDEQRVALTELAERGAQRAQRVVSRAAAEAAADLDDGQHRRAASSAASAAAGAISPSVALHGAVGDRSRPAARDLAPRKAPEPTGDDGRLRRKRALHPARRVLELRAAARRGGRRRSRRSRPCRAARRRSTRAGRCARGRTRRVAGRPSGVGQSYASGARWPRTTWTSALIAK